LRSLTIFYSVSVEPPGCALGPDTGGAGDRDRSRPRLEQGNRQRSRGHARIINVASAGGALGVSPCAIQPGTVVTDMAEGTLASPQARRMRPDPREAV